MRGSVTVHMAAPADRVWDLVSDITRVGEFSPETFEAQWLDGASGPALGARFRGHVRRNGRGPVYWTACTVTACDPGRATGRARSEDRLRTLERHGQRRIQCCRKANTGRIAGSKRPLLTRGLRVGSVAGAGAGKITVGAAGRVVARQIEDVD